MTRPLSWAVLLVMALVVPPAAAVQPRATISGPVSAAIGEAVLLDVRGSVTDPDTRLEVQVAGKFEATPSLQVWLDDVNIKPGLVVFKAPQPGNYTVVVVAFGVPDGATKPVAAVASWPIQVGSVDPVPPTPPGPEPGPNPPVPPPVPPTPPPAPVVTGKLWGMLVVPDANTPEQAALRTSSTIRKAFKSYPDTYYGSYIASEKDLQTPNWQSNLAIAGPLPAVFWINEAGKVLRITKAADHVKILDDLKQLRGGQ